MQLTLEAALNEACNRIIDTSTFVRAVLSGRRRNMQVNFERIDIRLVELKEVRNLQLLQSDGRVTTTKNFLPNRELVAELLESGYANIMWKAPASLIQSALQKAAMRRCTWKIEFPNKI